MNWDLVVGLILCAIGFGASFVLVYRDVRRHQKSDGRIRP